MEMEMETGAQRETEEMKSKKRKNCLQLQPGPFGDLISNYSYSRAAAGEINIGLQLPSGPLQEFKM